MRRWVGIITLGLLVGYALTGVAVIRPDERAVVRRFGAVVAHPGPGLWWGAPWGIDQLDRVPTQTVRRVLVGYEPDADNADVLAPAGQLLTGDQNPINVQLALYYDVPETDAGLDAFLVQQGRVGELLARSAEPTLAEWIAGRTIDEVLLTGNAALPAWVVPRTQTRLAPYGLGIRLTSASVLYLAPPDSVKPEFERVNRAQSAMRTQEEQARAEAVRRTARAATVAQTERHVAESYTAVALQQAQADADAFLRRWQQYRLARQTNPDVLTAIWWDELGQVLLRLRARGRIDVYDPTIAGDGWDILQLGPRPAKK
jgi:membrane protease subunit HflK